MGPNYTTDTVPIQATGLGLVNLIITAFFLLLIFGGNIDIKVQAGYISVTCITVYLSLHMPLVLLLTVKSNEKKKILLNPPVVNPPSELQFHEDSVEMSTFCTANSMSPTVEAPVTTTC